jgi:hypothetical protein
LAFLSRQRKKRNTGAATFKLRLTPRIFNGGDFMVKIITMSGEEEKFDSKDIKKDLEAAGLPERVAEEVAERVNDRVEDRWTSVKVNEQVDVELGRLEEDIQRAHSSYKNKIEKTMTTRSEETLSETRSETFVPEKDRDTGHHEHRHDIF